MKYFIGHLFQGDAATWCIELTKNISETFNTWKLHEKIPPHVTIIRPFETEDISSVKMRLKNWMQEKESTGSLIMSDFGRFEDRVVFVGVEADQVAKDAAKDLQGRMQEIPGIPKEEFPMWHPHATLANHLTPQEINQIWKYVSTLEKPNFTLPFNNVTIFRCEGDGKWVVEESY